MSSGEDLAGKHFGPLLADGKGRYNLLELIGSGSEGRVYRALDRQFARSSRSMVAIKISDFSEDMDEGVRARSVEHPNVVRVFDRGIDFVGDVNRIYVVFEYLEGKPLNEWLGTRKLHHYQLRSIVQSVCEGVQAIHAASIVHRDIKPSNIVMVGNRPVILDFGVSIQSLDAQTPAGTFGFMAPEQLIGSGDSTLVDVYAIGALIYWLETKMPINGDDREQAMERLSSGRAMDCSQIRNIRFREIIEKCVQPSPDARYQCPIEIYNDIESLHLGYPTRAGYYTPYEKRVLGFLRHPFRYFGVLLVLIVSLYWSYDRHENLSREIEAREWFQQGIRQMIFDMRFRDDVIDPAAYWALAGLGFNDETSVWAKKILNDVEGEQELRRRVLEMQTDTSVSHVTMGYWWWLLARVQVTAETRDLSPRILKDSSEEIPIDRTIPLSSYEQARLQFKQILPPNDPIFKHLEAEIKRANE